MPKALDLRGRQFGRWTALERVGTKNRHPLWRCRCECGTEGNVSSTNLVSGHSQSCGCLSIDVATERLTRHGHTSNDAMSPEYRTWNGMWRRCTNPGEESYPRYGGRGIRVCARWRTFENFLSDMGQKPAPEYTIERANTDGDYEPGNCRWATMREQMRNMSRNHLVTIEGETRCLIDWCERIGISYATVKTRMRRGMTDTDALTTPLVPPQESARRRWATR